MANTVVDISLGWEGNTLLDFLFLLIHFVSFLRDHVVTDLAQFKSRNTDNSSFDKIFQDPKDSLRPNN